jgi:hypothetical protein
MDFSKDYKKIYIYLLFTLIAFICRYYLFEGRDSWHDEWHSIYVADPNISNEFTINRFYGDKGDEFLTEFYPPLYLFILKYYFMIFGYTDDNGRWLSLIFGTLTIPLAMYLAEILNYKKKYHLIGFLITFNLFLTWQSIEIRAHSIFVAITLLNIILFYRILEKKNIISFFVYFITSVFLLSIWPITGAVFFGKTIYLIKEYLIKKNLEINIFIIFSLILLTYIFLNIDYLKFNLERDYHYTTLYKSFFVNFHFRSFFGSIFLGGLFLIIFSFLVIGNLKEIVFLNTRQNLIIYIIISSYFLTLLYTFLRASIMSPKYVLFILPLIIIWIGLRINTINFRINTNKIESFVAICSFIFFLININNSPMSRPPTKKVLNEAIKENIRYIVTIENDVFNNYLRTKTMVVKKNITILKGDELIPKNINYFWFLCQNNPRYAVGDVGLLSNNTKIESKCLNFNPVNEGFFEILPMTNNTQDYLIRKFKRTNN